MIAGKRVLLTGGSSGIGAATALAMARTGATVGIVGRRADRLDAVLEECRSFEPECRSWVADLGDLEHAESIVDEAVAAFGEVDVLVNNAAIPLRQPVDALTPAMVEEAIRVNFLSPVRMTLRVLPRMLARGGGVIVNVASMGGRVGVPQEAAYCASKFALTGWSEAMAMDLHGTGVSVRLVHPGPIDTDIWDRPGNRQPLIEVPKEPPGIVAQAIIDAIESDRFEHYVPDLKAVVELKESDIDAYIATNAALAAASKEGKD